MVKFNSVEETKGNRLEVGEHLVRIEEVRNTNQSGEIMLDNNNVEVWAVTYQNKDGQKYYDYLNFSGWQANKTGSLLKALGLLDVEEKLTETKKDFNMDDILGQYVYITISHNEKKKGTKYEFPIYENGFRAYEGNTKPEPKKEVEKAPF